jgi:hypothetical protein
VNPFHARGVRERLDALLTTRPLPQMKIDLACWRRLEAMYERLKQEDPSLATEPDAMEHIIYAAIMRGLVEDERDADMIYDENTGERIA